MQAKLLTNENRANEALALLKSVMEDTRSYGLPATTRLGLLLEKSRALEALGRADHARRTFALGKNVLRRVAARIRKPSARTGFLRADAIRRQFAAIR